MVTERQDSARIDTTGNEAMLQRILAAVERNRHRGRLEVVIAIVLSLATLCSTWCGYQARLWGGVESAKGAAADTAERQAAGNTIIGLQIRTQDGLLALEYWSALRQGDTKTSDTIFAHMRPSLRNAIQASIQAGVLDSPDLPGPFQRPEYSLAEEEYAKLQREQAGQLTAAAQEAGRTAGAYVLLTLMFASVLFFGGIAGTFTQRRVRASLAGVAVILFAVTVSMLLTLPRA